uniref:Trypomastigote small surface antigen n=1 Tax=Trypanosoma cruzi TaxID=5693 RepID=Q6ULN9_TRYCR|nr:trypomastigote small surface antigen [Trypanosoma cruzi]
MTTCRLLCALLALALCCCLTACTTANGGSTSSTPPSGTDNKPATGEAPSQPGASSGEAEASSNKNDGSLSSSAWVSAPLALAASALAYTALG